MLKMRCKYYNRGDTLIEALFAITIFSLVAVAGISIMNQGTATSQRALEISMVRNEIDAQAEAIRFLNSSYVSAFQNVSGATYTGPAADWSAIESLTSGVTSATAFGGVSSCPIPPANSFVLNTRTGKLVPVGSLTAASSVSQVKYDASGNVTSAEGIWIEAVHPSAATLTDMKTNNQDNASYVDFNIRACWDSPGNAAPITLGTIVRVYQPIYDSTPLPPTPPPAVPPAATPATPVVAANTVGSNTTYSWNAAVCDSGYTASYRYRYIIDYSGGFTSGWVTTTSRTSSYTTSDQGYQYTIQVQAQCIGGPSPSGWSSSGSASYIRPVSMPGVVAYGITKTSSTSVDLRATSSCAASPNVYLYSRMDVYITPSYGGWNWWWGDTRVGGWYATSHGPWLIDAWNWYGDTITVTMNMNPLWSGFPWRLAVELRCQNMVTGRASASTGRQESGNLNTP